jgi:hypothetical protein
MNQDGNEVFALFEYATADAPEREAARRGQTKPSADLLSAGDNQ